MECCRSDLFVATGKSRNQLRHCIDFTDGLCYDIYHQTSGEQMPTETEIRDLFNIPVGHFPDKSARWLFKEKENIHGLVEIVANELVEYLDFDGLVELNRSFVSDTLRELESDMVFSVPFRDTSEADNLLIYILIEHQSTIDPMMGFRLLFYMCQIWDGQRRELEASDIPKSKWRLRPILPIVFYTGTQRWQTPLALSALMDLPEILSRFVPKFDTLLFGVKETESDDLTKTNHPLGWLLTVLQKEDADRASMIETLREVFAQLDTFDTMSASQRRNAILYLSHLVLFRRPADERDELLQLVQTHTTDKEVENIIMTGAEALIEQGKVEGIEQGAKKFAIESILDLLGMQFPLDAVQSLQPELEQISDLNRLKALNRAAVGTDSLEAFRRILQEQQD